MMRDLDSGRAQWMSACVAWSILRQLRHSSQQSVAGSAGLAPDRILAIQSLGQRTGEGFQFFQLIAGKKVGMAEPTPGASAGAIQLPAPVAENL
jgi:hypothetical protein